MILRATTSLFFLILAAAIAPAAEPDDPYLWLEDIEGDRALDWVRQKNKSTLGLFESDPLYAGFKQTAERLVQDKERIPYGELRNGYVYNFWRDEEHVRGIWRRVKLDGYLEKNVPWEVLLDVDRLAEEENENWVFKRSIPLPPDYTRCLIALSRGGKDAVVVREFDVLEKAFVPDGFHLPEAKSDAAWFDRDTLIVGTDFGEGSLTTSGYPRVLKIWRRGQPLEEAKTLFEGQTEDVAVGYSRDFASPRTVSLIVRDVTFYEARYWLADDLADLTKVPVPDDAAFKGFFDGRLLFLLRSAWQPGGDKSPARPIPQGSLIALPAGQVVDSDGGKSAVEVLFVPDDRSSITDVACGKNSVYLNVLDNVRSRVVKAARSESSGKPAWRREPLPTPDDGTIRLISSNPFTDKLFFSYQGFLVPERLYLADTDAEEPKLVKTLNEKFDASGLAVEQLEAVSKDGTRVPYFVIGPKDLAHDGKTPTILYAYGGFEIPMLPRYLAVSGNLWLKNGGVYVLANIRGGGEFGPRWHQAALKENRQKAYDDFLAVAEDLIERKVTSPARLGIMGGSNGGLLMGVAFTQRPDLFAAVVCQVPLLDMLRYTKLLAGASWMAEYGDPDDEKMRGVISKYSPYQNVGPDVDYPEVFFLTSTKDDRVHPGHARKMVAKMSGMGHKVFYYENIEGGHGAAANLLQRAHRYALEYVYFHRKLFEKQRRHAKAD